MTISSAPDEALVLAAIEQVWGSMLFASAAPWPADRPAEFETGLQAQIELRGDWNGRLVLTCDSVVAGQIAGAMLGLGPEEQLDQPDVHDAVGEVLNVVGGSVKGALRGTSALGLPGVREVTAVPARDESFVVSWGDAPVYVQIVPDAA
ncbi:chemotaxis protein CheX [Nocardioides sp. LMS-CY]|uniref:chemotaxis protein CheX n=1 Tax=Nocardioides sp. (strain LMS-CY) TaxID=2840457 RepID=UPI001C00041C|nr:chemotaxis protein CheX [Nocardioides sp. LMS-CY]QWF21189.1 chemotaxis protein CheX [Nocardioides sp. LMS-CY]